MHERSSYILHGNNKLWFTFIYSKISDRCRVWLVARSQVIWFNFVLPACHEIFMASPWERSGSNLLQLNYFVFSLRTSTIKSNKASVWLVCHCEFDVWSTSHPLSLSFSVSFSVCLSFSVSLSSLIPVTLDSVIQRCRNTIKKLDSGSLCQVFIFLPSHTQLIHRFTHTLSPSARLPPISWKSQHPPALTSINQSACKRVLMIYASGWAPCSHGNSALTTVHKGW